MGPSPPNAAGERVAKVLARAGVASRRDIERLIAEGRVSMNGEVLTTPAVKVGPGDLLAIDGAPVAAREATRLFLYHKPPGLVTTHRDPGGRPTVFQALPPGLPRLISVGRLDLNSEGLLLLTNDGELSRALELPATGLPRRYRARARGRIDQGRLDALRAGLEVEGVRYGPITAHLDKVKDASGEGRDAANLWISVSLTEGKNREVRRVLEALGLKVNRLIRLAYGPFALGTLERGAVQEVDPRVVRELLGAFIAPDNLPSGDRAQWRPKPPAAPREAAGPSRRADPPPSDRSPKRKSASGKTKPGPHTWLASDPTRPKPRPTPAGARPGSAKTGSARPGSGKPGSVKPGSGKPGSGRPGAPRKGPSGPRPRKPG